MSLPPPSPPPYLAAGFTTFFLQTSSLSTSLSSQSYQLFLFLVFFIYIMFFWKNKTKHQQLIFVKRLLCARLTMCQGSSLSTPGILLMTTWLPDPMTFSWSSVLPLSLLTPLTIPWLTVSSLGFNFSRLGINYLNVRGIRLSSCQDPCWCWTHTSEMLSTSICWTATIITPPLEYLGWSVG